MSLAAMLLGNACEEVEAPYREGNPAEAGETACLATADTSRHVLIEEFTGFKCGTCPPAVAEAKDVMADYPERVHFIGLHAGGFAVPDGSGAYTDDLRTEPGEDLYQYYAIQTNPIGLVNRREYDLSGEQRTLLSYTLWRQAVERELARPSALSMCVEPSYQDSNRGVTVNVALGVLRDLPEDQFLVVTLNEDSVITTQKDYTQSPSDLPGYAQSHVLRAHLNGTWGSPVSETSLAAGDERALQFSGTLNPAWDADNIYVQAYVYDNTTKAIRQICEVKLLGQ
jgi:hypothetical protein